MSWQKILARGFDSAEALLNFLGLPSTLASSVAERQFKTRVPLSFAMRMHPGDAQDPLLLQVLAQPEELLEQPDFVSDPLQESTVNPVPGLLHKYHGRVLLTLVGACAVNCRYCFRREFPYVENNPGRGGWSAILEYIRQDSSIEEVILSGGDPLLASNTLLAEFFEALASIKHIKILRFHTRFPVVLPERIDQAFLTLLKSLPWQKVMVLHVNHRQEINDTVAANCAALQAVGCVLLNQSVLLRGVNDKAQVLAQLSRRLFDCGVLPYYLHRLDKVRGTTHFDLSSTEVQVIYQELAGLLPGYLLPRLVSEVPGERSKRLISMSSAEFS